MHIKERGSVQAAGAIEDWLVGAQRLRQPAQHLRRHAEVGIGRAQATMTNGFNRGLAADAATEAAKKFRCSFSAVNSGVL